MMYRSRFVPLALCAALALPSFAWAGPVSESVPATEDGAVNVVAVATELEIVGTDAKKITVVGQLPDNVVVEVRRKAKSTEIVVKHPKRSRGTGQLKITVPRGSELHARTVSGDLTASGVTGEVSLEAVTGNISCRDAGSEVSVATVSGDVDVEGGTKRTRARAVSGDVTVHRARGQVDASVVSGDVKLVDAAVSRTRVQATSGSVEFDGRFSEPGPHELTTHAGSIRMHLDPSVAVEIDAASHAGVIRDEITGTKTRRSARLVHGEGGPTVRARSFAGSVVIKRRS
jgi:DUF4097 and DUF4098 domain-containing protein YvlB